jgi:DNA-binding transcriptional regulator PaaX
MKLGKAERVALQVIGGIGLIALVAVAPGMGLVLKQLGMHKKLSSTYVPTLMSRLRRKGYIVTEIRNGKKYARLTPHGQKRLDEYREQNKRMQAIKRPRRWDGKWHMVTFDIPERFRQSRDQIRSELREAGFIQLHRSVWVTPYPCEEFVALLKADKHVGKNLLYIIADTVEYSSALKKKFNI